MKAIANDEGLVEVICNDPLGGGARPPLGFLLSIFEVRPDLEPEDFGLCPVLFMHPTEDHWTSLDASKEFFDRLASRDKEFALLEGCGHFRWKSPESRSWSIECNGSSIASSVDTECSRPLDEPGGAHLGLSGGLLPFPSARCWIKYSGAVHRELGNEERRPDARVDRLTV